MKLFTTKIGVLSVALAMTVSSCNKEFLNAVPELDLSDATVFSTPARVLSQVNGLYGSAKSGALFGGRYLIYNDIRGEDWVNRTTNSVTGYSTYQGNQDPSDSYLANFWIQGYLTINRTNLFLEGLAKNPNAVSPALAANYRGEAKFLRALTYFSLVQFFAKPYILDKGASAGLPLRLKGSVSSADNDMPRSTVAQVYAQVLQDLNDAENDLPDSYGTALLNTTRAHKNTVIALKTRVKLAMGDYAGVIADANKIVTPTAPFRSTTRVAHALQSDVTNVFKAPFTTTESVFSFPMDATNPPGTQNQLGFYFNGGNGNVEYYLNTGPTGIYNNPQFAATDDRKTKLTVPTTAIAKFPSLTKFAGVTPFVDFVPNIRYAEVLLNLAEAEAETGNLTRATALLRAVHGRSDASYVFPALDTKAAVISAILTERRIEFLGEGFRANDVLRRGMPLNSFGAGTIIQPSDPRYIYGIPLAEVQTNPSIGK